jgi:hypothetical protein
MTSISTRQRIYIDAVERRSAEATNSWRAARDNGLLGIPSADSWAICKGSVFLRGSCPGTALARDYLSISTGYKVTTCIIYLRKLGPRFVCSVTFGLPPQHHRIYQWLWLLARNMAQG